MAIYMKTPSVKGSATAPKYKEWIELEGFELGTSRSIKMQVGRGNDREYEAPAFEPVTVTKLMDVASPALFNVMCNGKAMSQVEIHVVDTQGERIKYILSDVLIANRKVVAASELQPVETLDLSYSKIQEIYTPRDKNHNPLATFSSGYDLTKAASM